MKILLTLSFLLFYATLPAQNIKDRYASQQSQDFSVPPPPKTTFPAQFSGGNKLFLNNVTKNIDKTLLVGMPKLLTTKIILKIDGQGKVLNISTFSNNKIFDKEVKRASEIANMYQIWEPGKNSSGEKVTDIVTLPFKIKN